MRSAGVPGTASWVRVSVIRPAMVWVLSMLLEYQFRCLPAISLRLLRFMRPIAADFLTLGPGLAYRSVTKRGRHVAQQTCCPGVRGSKGVLAAGEMPLSFWEEHGMRQRYKACVLRIVPLVCLCGIAAWQARGAQTVTMPKVDAVPTVDGDLSDAVWKQAARFGPFLKYQGGVENPPREPAAVQTTAFAAYDDRALYVAFRCEEPDTGKLVANIRENDASVQRDDSVELFILPGAHSGNYYHFIVNSLNTRTDQRNIRHPFRSDTAWDGVWQSAARVIRGKAWCVEMAIPWYNLAVDVGTGQWKLNFCRSRRAGGKPAYSSFALVSGNFHSVADYAVLERPDIPYERLGGFLATDVSIPAYGLADKGYAYTVTGRLINDTAKPRKVIVALEDRPTTGGSTMVHTDPITITALRAGSFRETVPMPAPGSRKLGLRILDAADGSTLFVTAYPAATFPDLLTAYLCRNLYTHERAARATFDLGIPGRKDGFSARLAVTLPDGKPLVKQAAMTGTGPARMTLPLAAIPYGTHPVRLSVLGKGGGLVVEEATVLRRQPPAKPPMREVKIDHERVCMLVDDEPYFPIGLFGVPQRLFPTIAEAGFNTVVPWYPVRREGDGTSYLKAAHKAGLMVVEQPSLFHPREREKEYGRLRYANPQFPKAWDLFVEKTVPEVVAAVRNEPSLFLYFGPDEPPPDAAGREYVTMFNEKTRALDPYHPNLTSFYLWVPPWEGTYDVAGMDFYGPGYNTPVSAVYDTVRKSVKVLDRMRIPCFHVPLLEQCSASRNFLTGPMQQAQGYLTIIGGAKSIQWWNWPPRYPENWEALQQLAGEFSQLAPVLVTYPPEQKVVYSDPATDYTVRALVKNHAGKTVLITCNGSPAPASAVLRLPDGAYRGSAKVLFEDRTVALTGNAIADRYPAYGRHVYELAGRWPAGARLTLDIHTEQEKAAPMTAAKEEKEPETPNLLLAPGLEAERFWRFVPGDPKQGRVSGRFVSDRVNGGRKAFFIERPRNGEGRATLSGWPVRLKANTRYVFGGYAMALGGRARMYLDGPRSEKRSIREDSTLWVQDRTLGFIRYEVSFTTGPKPVTVNPVCQFEGGGGQAWFDDLFLYEDTKRTSNLAYNASFEREVMPAWPDGWSCGYGILEPGYVGDPDGPWYLDSSTAHSGKKSMRLRKDGDLPGRPELHQYKSRAIDTPAGPYVISAWMKADRPGVQFNMWVSWIGRTVTVDSTEWKRYWVPVVFQGSGTKYIQFSLESEGALWVDDVQFEPGTKPTPYAEGR